MGPEMCIRDMEVVYVVEALKKIVGRLRAMSPLYDEFCKAQEG